MHNRLLYREWLVIVLVIGLIASLIAFSWFSESRSDSVIAQNKGPLKQTEGQIAIEVVGAVQNPGIYFFNPGITVGEAVKTLELLKEADRRKIPKKRVLFHSERIEIPFKTPRKKAKDKDEQAQNFIVRKSKVLLASSLWPSCAPLF